MGVVKALLQEAHLKSKLVGFSLPRNPHARILGGREFFIFIKHRLNSNLCAYRPASVSKDLSLQSGQGNARFLSLLLERALVVRDLSRTLQETCCIQYIHTLDIQ